MAVLFAESFNWVSVPSNWHESITGPGGTISYAGFKVNSSVSRLTGNTGGPTLLLRSDPLTMTNLISLKFKLELPFTPLTSLPTNVNTQLGKVGILEASDYAASDYDEEPLFGVSFTRSDFDTDWTCFLFAGSDSVSLTWDASSPYYKFLSNGVDTYVSRSTDGVSYTSLYTFSGVTGSLTGSVPFYFYHSILTSIGAIGSPGFTSSVSMDDVEVLYVSPIVPPAPLADPGDPSSFQYYTPTVSGAKGSDSMRFFK